MFDHFVLNDRIMWVWNKNQLIISFLKHILNVMLNINTFNFSTIFTTFTKITTTATTTVIHFIKFNFRAKRNTYVKVFYISNQFILLNGYPIALHAAIRSILQT